MKYIITLFFLILLSGCQNEPVKNNIMVKYNDTKPIIDKVIKEQIIKHKEIKRTEQIAIIYVSKIIGKYAIEATNTAMTYLLSKKSNFELKVFSIENEDYKSISTILDYLEKVKIQKVIFLLTSNHINELFKYKNIDYFKLYLPLVNNNKNIYRSSNIIYGGIDYKKQFNLLLKSSSDNIVEIYDDSVLGEMLHSNLISDNNKTIVSLKLMGKNPNYAYFLKNNKIIENSTIILNMSIIKSSILLSQIQANEIVVNKILSTQINYTPLLLVLTQKDDRERLVISNLIEELPRKVEYLSTLFGNDILNNWVNFSTILGVEYLLTDSNLLFDKINIIDNKVEYNINLLDVSGFSFKIIKTKDEK